MDHRQFKLSIWGLALGYFLFYAPYSLLIKIVTTRSQSPVSGFRLLPAVAISTVVVLSVIVSFKGWWTWGGRRSILGRMIICPSPLLILSGFGTAIIIATTTLAFTFHGVSIVFALLLMRGGVLIMAPLVDSIFRRSVRWFSWAALAITLPALLIALADVTNYRLTIVASLTIAAYLSGYLLRLPCVTALAKSRDDEITYRYFVEEQMVAMFFLITIPVVLALIGKGAPMLEIREGFTGFFSSGVTLPALLIGALYAGLYCFGTLIYLDCRENTFCIPLNRGSSLLAGVAAGFAVAVIFGVEAPSIAQLASAGLIAVALLFLSPLHHFDRVWARVNIAFSNLRPKPAIAERIFLFVCSGNTCRSPIAAAISNSEIATRMGIPFAELETVNVRALSAGLSARVGASLSPEAQQALCSLNVPVGPHAARNLTAELADKAEMIFCMTKAQRQAVIQMIPSAFGKTYCLDPERDIEDPVGLGIAAYHVCARHIRRLVRLRFDEIGFVRAELID